MEQILWRDINIYREMEELMDIIQDILLQISWVLLHRCHIWWKLYQIMPVPGYGGGFQIVVVAGDGKRRGAVDGQFPPSGIGLGIAGGQGHGKSSFFGEIILPIWRNNTIHPSTLMI